MDRGPQVQDVALHRAVGVEALAAVFAKVSRKGVPGPRIAGLAMDGTGAAALLVSAVQLVEEAQVVQHLVQGDLPAQVGRG